MPIPMSRSTWACELKFSDAVPLSPIRTGHAPRERVSWNFLFRPWTISVFRHAPRERVSWNSKELYRAQSDFVTLHVSVWVEIWYLERPKYLIFVTLHVSVWVEIADVTATYDGVTVTLHVSVWVEIYRRGQFWGSWKGHAPRERVSWNVEIFVNLFRIHVTLHVSVWVEIACWN